jgi:triphosphoribosyl-dephospho-CoA synthase
MTIGECARLACILEATTRKPGNVHPGQDFPGLTYLDLTRSAAAIAPVLDHAPGRPVGKTVLECIRATARNVNKNTNLGIVLLLAPLAAGDDIAKMLDRLTVDDAVHVYEAIRLAKPGGLGHVAEQDVFETPTVTLRDAMALAADRDSIARQYVNNFADVFEGAKHLSAWRAGSVSDQNSLSPVSTSATNGESLLRLLTLPARLEESIIHLHLWFLAQFPDSLVVRKRGPADGQELQSLAQKVLADPAQLPKLDTWFAAAFPHRNPGTTADLVCASLFVALRAGIITLPLSPEWPPLFA